jgi:tripartite ATP-independent transporter DctP family solute receptor
MAENLAAGGSGIDMEVFPAAQLGSNVENIENIVGGNLTMSIVGFGELSRYHPPMSVLDANYVFEDFDHMREVARGEIGQELYAGLLQAAPVRVLDLWFGGLRVVSSNTAVRTPDDLAGLKLRAIESPIGLANVASLGAEPTPVAFPELYLGLSQGVVDGQENPVSIIDSAKLYEVQDFVSLTNHAVFAAAVVISEPVWQSMSTAQQEALMEEVMAAGDRDRECVDNGYEEILQRWADEDLVEVIEDVDIDAFRARAEAELPPQFEDTWGDLYQRIRAAA